MIFSKTEGLDQGSKIFSNKEGYKRDLDKDLKSELGLVGLYFIKMDNVVI